MNSNKVKTIILITSVILLSCSQIQMKTGYKSRDVSKFKNSGIILRINSDSVNTRQEYVQGMKHLLFNYKFENNLKFINNISDDTGKFSTHRNRFYQESIKHKYLEPETKGKINAYFEDNRDELERLIVENSLDSVIIAEILTSYSSVMGAYYFETFFIVTDADLNTAYYDFQYIDEDNVFPYLQKPFNQIDETDSERFKNEIIIQVSRIIISRLEDLDYISEK